MRTHSLLRAALSLAALTGMLGVTAGLAEQANDDHRAHHGKRGALFVMTNATDTTRGNEIAMYRRAGNGDLSIVGYFPTGVLDKADPQLGSGPAPTAQVFRLVDTSLPPVVASADGLGSANSLVLSEDKRCLFAVNAGSHSVSAFRVHDDGLTLVSVVPSRGVFPASLTVHNDLMYVLNAGAAGSLAGFRVTRCTLQPLNAQPVSLTGVADAFPIPAPGEVLTTPAQVSFTPDGRRLVLSIKGGDPLVSGGRLQALPSGRMAVFAVHANGQLGTPTVTRFNALGSGALANTGGPFSFVFTEGRTLITVHANSGTVGAFTLNPDNTLSLNGPPLSTGAFAPCWLDSNGRFVYTASFGAPSGVRQIIGEGEGLPDRDGLLTGFRLNRDGTLAPLGVTVSYPAPSNNGSGNHAIDVRVIDDFLYFIQPRTGRIGRLTIGANGDLTDMKHYAGLAPGLEPFAGNNSGIDNFLERCFAQDPANVSPECLRGSAQGIAGF
jgi:hypothetical protein